MKQSSTQLVEVVGDVEIIKTRNPLTQNHKIKFQSKNSNAIIKNINLSKKRDNHVLYITVFDKNNINKMIKILHAEGVPAEPYFDIRRIVVQAYDPKVIAYSFKKIADIEKSYQKVFSLVESSLDLSLPEDYYPPYWIKCCDFEWKEETYNRFDPKSEISEFRIRQTDHGIRIYITFNYPHSVENWMPKLKELGFENIWNYNVINDSWEINFAFDGLSEKEMDGFSKLIKENVPRCSYFLPSMLEILSKYLNLAESAVRIADKPPLCYNAESSHRSNPFDNDIWRPSLSKPRYKAF